MVFDIHGDIWTDVAAKREEGLKNIIKNNHLERFKEGNMLGGIFILWIDPPHDKDPKPRLRQMIKSMSMEIAQNRDILKVIYNSKDFYEAKDQGKLAVLLGIEGLSGIGEDVEELYSLYQLGFRHASLTWNEENDLGTGAWGDKDRGLTDLGREAVKIMEELGMIIDVSHANDKTFWDIYNASKGPFIASHSNARALCDVPRNITDEQIKAIGGRDGLVGINAFNEFVHKDKDKRDADHLIDHIDHIANLIGIDKIALGFDFFEYIGDETSNTFINDPYVGTKGIEDISQAPKFIDKLSQRGYSDEDIAKISYKNFLDLMDRVL